MDEEDDGFPIGKYLLIGGIILVGIILFVVFAIRAGHPTANIVNGTTVSKNVECKLTNRMPDPICTPGEILPVPQIGLCSPDYPNMAVIDDTTALEVYKRYGITDTTNWNLVFYIPIRLGGGTGMNNIYPISNDYPGYAEREIAVDRLYTQLCTNGMPIEVAQDIITRTWQDTLIWYE